MADRLNIILVQRSGLGPKSESLIEAIVGHLAGRPGMDLVLISPLSDITANSTDQLTLSSISTDAAVLTWTDAEQTIKDLEKLSFSGVRASHRGDPAASGAAVSAQPSNGRKIYAIDLRSADSVDEVIEQMNRLREVKSVKTFQLGSLAPPSNSKPSPASTSGTATNSSQPLAQTQKGLNPIQRTEPKELSTREKSLTSDKGKASPTATGDPDSDANLDSLIDQLDQFDI